MMKDFSQFLKEEITIKGNTGLPGEHDKNEPNYLSDIDKKGSQLIRGQNPRTLIPRIMELVDKSKSFVKGKEKELEALAEEVIRESYSGILENVTLDIKFVKTGSEIAEFMEEEKDNNQPPKKSTDKDLKLEVDKRKLANNIIQGEAKNTKHILHSDIVKEGLKKIYGEDKSKEIFSIWDETTQIADKLDWIIPIDQKADMMEMAPEGLAGACSIEWPEAEESDKDKAEKVLKSLEKGDDLESNSEDLEEVFSNGNPIVKARGIDFPMLIHESVKGIYELLAAAGIPKDETIATNVLLNTSSFDDEAEDFRYGPYLAADLRDFVNKNSKVNKHPNLREFLFGKLIELPAEEFLITMKGIFMNTPESRKKIDTMLDEIIAQLDTYEKDLSEWELRQKFADKEEIEDHHSDDEGGDLENVPKWWEENEIENIANKSSKKDISELSQREIQELIDDALDKNDFDEVKRISQYLKEGKEVYLREIELSKSHKNHTRRNNI